MQAAPATPFDKNDWDLLPCEQTAVIEIKEKEARITCGKVTAKGMELIKIFVKINKIDPK